MTKLGDLITESKTTVQLTENCKAMIAPLEQLNKQLSGWDKAMTQVAREVESNKKWSDKEKVAIIHRLQINYNQLSDSADNLLKAIKYIAKSEGEIK